MAEFCTCGSLMVDGTCTNKNCSTRASAKSASLAKRVGKAKSSKTEKTATARTRRASKCITYNLNDKIEKVENS